MKEVGNQVLCSAKKYFDKKTYTKGSRKRKKTLRIESTFHDLKGMPKFKSKKNYIFSYTTYNQSQGGKWNLITLKNGFLSIPKLKSSIKVKVHKSLPQKSIIKNCTLSMINKCIFYVSSVNERANYQR